MKKLLIALALGALAFSCKTDTAAISDSSMEGCPGSCSAEKMADCDQSKCGDATDCCGTCDGNAESCCGTCDGDAESCTGAAGDCSDCPSKGTCGDGTTSEGGCSSAKTPNVCPVTGKTMK